MYYLKNQLLFFFYDINYLPGKYVIKYNLYYFIIYLVFKKLYQRNYKKWQKVYKYYFINSK